MGIIDTLGGYDPYLTNQMPYFIRFRNRSLAILLLVPTLTSFFAMFLMLNSYNIFHWSIITLAAVLWAIIIFLIDRALFLFPKKEDMTKGEKWLSMALRFGISLIVSFTISNSLLVYLNEGEIDNALQKITDSNITFATEQEQEQLKKNLQKRQLNDDNITNLNDDLKKLSHLQYCEDSGRICSIRLSDGKEDLNSSGKPNRTDPKKNPQSEYLKTLVTQKTQEVTKFKNITDEYKQNIQQLQQSIKKKGDDINQSFKKDYSVKNHKMYEIAFKDWLSTLHTLAWFFLFLIVDMIAITLKTVYPSGIYEHCIWGMEKRVIDSFKNDSNSNPCETLNQIYPYLAQNQKLPIFGPFNVLEWLKNLFTPKEPDPESPSLFFSKKVVIILGSIGLIMIGGMGLYFSEILLFIKTLTTNGKILTEGADFLNTKVVPYLLKLIKIIYH